MSGRFPVEFHPAAEEEVVAAFEWYRERSEQAAVAFAAEIDRAIQRITESPDRCQNPWRT